MKAALRCSQDMLLSWSVSTKPVVEQELGTALASFQPLSFVVIGQTTHRRLMALYRRGESTSAGRLPACSRPACGSKSSQTISSCSGQ